jgi:hypothetical protein
VVTTELIRGTPTDLARQITAARPHVLHLLCHGMEVAGVRTLAFATIGDVDSDRSDFGSLSLPLSDLFVALQACDPWLVVLAACETAQAAEAAPAGATPARSFAHDLVSAGVTAAIGMRRLVDLQETDRFTRELYPEVLAAVRAAIQPVQPGEQIIDWASVLTGPRKVMGGADPSQVDSWLDPVLYVQNDDLRVFPQTEVLSADDYTRMKGQLDQYRGFLASQDPDNTDPAVETDIRDRMADIEAILSQAGA